MADLVSDNLLLTALVVAVLGFFVPRLMSHFLPEGVRPLLLNAFLSTVLLFLLSAGFFVCIYVWRGVPFSEISDRGFLQNISFFGRLGLMAAIIWAPIMLLSVAGLPRKWVKETW